MFICGECSLAADGSWWVADEDDETYSTVAFFICPMARERAEEYVAWLNSKEPVA